MSDELIKRIEALESEIKTIKHIAISALGEAAFAGTMASTTVFQLVRIEILPIEALERAIDTALLIQEKAREDLPPWQKAAMDETRARLEAQFRFLKTSGSAR